MLGIDCGGRRAIHSRHRLGVGNGGDADDGGRVDDGGDYEQKSTVTSARTLAHVTTSSMSTYSSGACATRVSPGPYWTVGMPPMPTSRRRSDPYGPP